MQTNIRIISLKASFRPAVFRSPLKFGSGEVRQQSLATVEAEVETVSGKRGRGIGQILLSDLWAWPGQILTHDQRDAAMRDLVHAACAVLAEAGRTPQHPIDLYASAKSALMALGDRITAERKLAEPVNALTVLLCAAPADAAIHDAFGVANGVSCYRAYGKEFCEHDLSRWLGPTFKGQYVADHLQSAPAATMPIFHLVGALDALTAAQVPPNMPDDGLPKTLEQWIVRDGVYCLKVKLRGNDVTWDVRRTASVSELAAATLLGLNRRELHLSVDFNEMCPSPDYVIEFLHKLKEARPAAFASLRYVEQPTERDLEAHAFDMRKLAAIKPVIVDESVYNLDQIDRAFDLGWSGVALKTCKGQTNSLFYIAKAAAAGRFYTIQDLTNPGYALVQSASLAAWSSPLIGFEYNARQFLPWLDIELQTTMNEVFRVSRGQIRTQGLETPGFGYRR